ncbi:uncharacterized protein F4807DRAFT_413505 [Annulohypoxylon truncatum]|uniref:uncharacterized protein n=1 Tax=Annulohypoxylon truncatum TaxID=327061 RepID=UPI002007879E|nr:uncharacterized protein F4807DRAFT_413505 [Annulohypoxylon truncatum]KAI1212556.1 hypothetical protein F4807DRAFT_413505 [Annulohypoxylon truncatum]
MEVLVDMDSLLIMSRCIIQNYSDRPRSTTETKGGSQHLQSLAISASNNGTVIVLEHMGNGRPTRTVVRSYEPGGPSCDSNGSNDNGDYSSPSQTSIGAALSDSDDESDSGVDVNSRPDIGTLPKQIEAVVKNDPTPTSVPRLFWYHCKTEPTSINSVYVRVRSPGLIYRWKPGSTITFNVNCDSFPSTTYREYAAASLERAAEERNKGKVGVRFERIADEKPAVFQLKYSDCCRCHPDHLAVSFFPRDPPSDRRLCVYGPAFEDALIHKHMADIFCHELGHILGLRHEFAQTCPKEQQDLSVQLGKRNDSSVMNYFDHPGLFRIQETDYDGVRRLYESCNGGLDGYKIVDESPRPFAPL